MSKSPESILIVAGHATWHKKKWVGIEESRFSPREIQTSIEAHVENGCKLVNSKEYDVIVFSGGKTRPNEYKKNNKLDSEAKGMKKFAKQKGWLPENNVVLEAYARDSFENVFFSMLAFKKEYGNWPKRVGVISMPHKSIRFMLMATGLKISEFTFHGIGKVSPLDTNCINEMRNMTKVVDIKNNEIKDPFLRDKYFEKKRVNRTTPSGYGKPKNYTKYVMKSYSGNNNLFKKIESGSDWYNLTWPWNSQ